jgi:Asp/Glu/hydantoin racemase
MFFGIGKKTMRILYIDLSGLGIWDDHFQILANQFKCKGNTVEVRHLENSNEEKTPFLPTRPTFYNDLFQTIIQAEEGGFHGVIIGCSSDPGLRIAHFSVKVPVFSPLKTALHCGFLIGTRLAILSPMIKGHKKKPISWYEDTVAAYDFPIRKVAIRFIEVELAGQEYIDECVLSAQWEELKETILSGFRKALLKNGVPELKRMIDNEGVDVAYLACTFWGGMGAVLHKEVSIPVLDPVETVIRNAETSVQLGWGIGQGE